MTTPTDAIAGLSERLRFDAVRCELQFSKGVASNIDAAATAIDTLQARVKELEDGLNFWKSERDRIKSFLSEGDWQTVKSEQAWRNRALRAEQERDEAIEVLKSFAIAADLALAGEGSPEDFLEEENFAEASDLVLRLSAGPEKEKKE